MPIITLSDGSQRYYNYAVTPMDVALDINQELAKIVIACRINGELVDVFNLIENDVKLFIITINDNEGLEIIRHSCLHLLNVAIEKLWPNAKIAANSVIDNNFYCNINLDRMLTQKDINILEKYMHGLIDNNHIFVNESYNQYRTKNISISKSIDHKKTILNNVYQNENIYLHNYRKHTNMCQIPYVPNISFCHHFKLIKITNVYAYRSSNSKLSQRIYGTAWANEKALNNYLNLLEEATKRDHRKIGKQLDLYHTQEEAPGMVFWHNNGWIIFRELESFIRSKLKDYQYQEVKGPFMMDRTLWEKTGHWDNYKDAMFVTSSENREYCIKPMNCLGHVQIFNQGLKSYRDLPLRIAEFGSCHRNEPSGALHGLMRVRSFTQDDAHIFCMKEQIHSEVDSCIRMMYDTYSTFGFKKVTVKLSTRPKKRIGNDAIWDCAETSLALSLKENNISFEYQLGEGAFYGPKIEFILYDCLDRAWQCGTIQLDFSLPQRLGSFYIDKNNKRQVPVIIHRAILGSLERFIGILIEEFAGSFPTWLAPIQVVIMNITGSQSNYVKELMQRMQNVGIRAKMDLRNEKISFKIREHTLRHVPYMLICGDKEVKTSRVTVRTRHGKNLGDMDINDIIKRLQREVYSYSLQQLEE